MAAMRWFPAFFALALVGCSGEKTAADKNSGGEDKGQPAATSGYTPETGGESLAQVGDSTISEKELEAQLNRANIQSAESIPLEKKQEALDKLIDNELLYQEAQRTGFGEHPRVKLMMVSLLQREAIGSKGATEITEEELRSYYEEHKTDYVIPEKVRARRILVRFGADKQASQQRANAIQRSAAASPKEFAKVAREKGEGPERARSGELGFFAETGRPGLDPVLVERAFKTEAGKVTEAFSSPEGWNIVKVESRSPRTERTFEQVRKSVERRLQAQRRRDALDTYIADLRKNTDVSVSKEKLEAFTPKIQPRPAFPKGGMPSHMGGMPRPNGQRPQARPR